MTPHELWLTRNKLGLTQTGLAVALGLSEKNGSRTIRRWEQGKWPIPKSIELALGMLTQTARDS